MPWTAEDMRKKGARDPARAAAIANETLARCLRRGGKQKVCEVRAIIRALFIVNKTGAK